MILRTVRDERDTQRYAAFHLNTEGLFGDTPRAQREAWSLTCYNLLHYHPDISNDDFVLVEDERTGEVVSTICLIPWHCRYEEIPLEVAMLENVATHPDYRRRGLMRAQVKRFHQMVSARRYDLSIVWGIPYFYRQFGYAYAIDLHGSDTIPAWAIPDAAEGEVSPYALRQASLDDVPVLSDLYREEMAAVQIHDARELDYWPFLLEWLNYPLLVVVDRRDGRIVGYVCVDEQPETGGTKVVESAIPSQDVAMFILRWLKAEHGGKVDLGWPQTGTLVQVARTLGGAPLPSYQWFVRITDLANLLMKIGPVLERRIAASAVAGATADLSVNFFREAFVLKLRRGKLLEVDSVGFMDYSVGVGGGDFCIPLEAFVRLILGYQELDELRGAWPDIVVKPESRLLVDVLFPRMTSFFIMPWQYCGPVNALPGGLSD
jgi:GNAT superfamily N-acetyltransferase